MVRLKAGAAPVGEIGLTAFQFHYGTIKRYSTHIPRAYPFLYFNSTMVRLKENRAEFFHLFYFYFNSTMVRLKEYASFLEPHVNIDFNSTMVRLKGITRVIDLGC